MSKSSVNSSSNKLWKSILLLIPMLLIMLVFMTGGNLQFNDPSRAIAFVVTYVFFAWLFFMMLRTGKTDVYRAVGFITLAVFFAFSFIVNLIEIRGSMTFSNDNIYGCDIPFCHMVTSMIIIPLALKQSIIFPGSLTEGFAPILGMLVFVIGFSVVLGRGFCSWGCFYGGWEDGTSRILKRPVIKRINKFFRWSAFVVLGIVAIVSAFQLSPFYCDWLCPFKAVTEFEAVTSTTVLIKTIVFCSLFIGLVIVLPILTKKRIQCASFCPMGALMSLTNKINIFDVRIDKDACIKCNQCEKICPTLSITKKDIEKGRPSFTCTKCGKCIDSCPSGAIHFHVKGTPVNKRVMLARILFLYPAFTMMVVFTGGTIQTGIYLLIRLITTGGIL